MLFNKSIFAVAIMALANVVAAGTTTVQTPACVLKIIGGTANPADSKAICGSDASKIQAQISKNCADSDASLKFFANNCAQLGHKVETSSATEKSTATSGAATASGFVTAASSGNPATQTGSSAQATATSGSASGSAAGSSSASGSASSPTSTFNAASSDRQFGATTLFAAVFMGAAALL